MNQDRAIRTEILDLESQVMAHGFSIHYVEPTFLELVTGMVSVGATDYEHHVIELQSVLQTDDAMRMQVLAHELGHVVLGHGDANGPTVEPRLAETQANRWAINLLSAKGLPTDQIAEHEREAHDPDNPSGMFYAGQSEALGFDQQ